MKCIFIRRKYLNNLSEAPIKDFSSFRIFSFSYNFSIFSKGTHSITPFNVDLSCFSNFTVGTSLLQRTWCHNLDLKITNTVLI